MISRKRVKLRKTSRLQNSLDSIAPHRPSPGDASTSPMVRRTSKIMASIFASQIELNGSSSLAISVAHVSKVFHMSSDCCRDIIPFGDESNSMHILIETRGEKSRDRRLLSSNFIMRQNDFSCDWPMLDVARESL